MGWMDIPEPKRSNIFYHMEVARDCTNFLRVAQGNISNDANNRYFIVLSCWKLELYITDLGDCLSFVLFCFSVFKDRVSCVALVILDLSL